MANYLGRKPNTPHDVWKYIDHRGPDECWPWKGGKCSSGYGSFMMQNRVRVAHRIAFEAATGKAIPEGMLACHRCDNPACCNPDHIFIGTHKDNSDDKHAKGRAKILRGTSHGMCKLKPDQVIEIRMMVASGKSKAEVGRVFGITARHAALIHERKLWRSLP